MAGKGKNKKTSFEESAKLNNRTYGHYLMMLTDLACSSFEWKNLPATVNPRYLELSLFFKGSAVFFDDEDLDAGAITGVNEPENDGHCYLCLDVINNSQLNVYHEPVRYSAYSTGYYKPLDNSNSVIIYNNLLHTNNVEIAKLFARRLYNLDRIIDVNSNAQKTPYVIVCDDTERLSYLNLYKEVDGNAPVIFGSNKLDLTKMKVLQTEAPYISDKLYELKTKYWNEALTYLGISNITEQKKERLITDEVARSQGGTIASRYSRELARKKAAEKINEMFGLNVEVNFKENGFDDRNVSRETIREDESDGEADDE